MRDLVDTLRKRIDNQFDANIVISGARGTGKSTLAWKIASKFDCFDPWKHIVYDRDSVIELLATQKRGVIWDDESINSGFKRSFYDKDQQQLIKYLNMYRDKFNVFIMCIPNFYDLDKAMRSLVKIHINIIRRYDDYALAAIHIADNSANYSTDPWATAVNLKKEMAWQKVRQRNPNFLPPYHKLTTFVGYLKYGDVSPKERELYQTIKDSKRKELHDKEKAEEEKKDPISQAYEKTIDLLMDGKFTTSYEIQRQALIFGIKLETFKNRIREKLRERGEEKSLMEILKDNKERIESEERKDKYAAKRQKDSNVTLVDL